MADSSSKNIELSQEDDTFVDETPRCEPHNDSELDTVSDKVEPCRKRKQATKVKCSKKKPKKTGKERAVYWNYFDVVFLEEEDGVEHKYGRCKWCKADIRADPIRNGTNGLNKHYPICESNPEVIAKKSQTNLVLKKEGNGEGSVIVWTQYDARIHKALLDLFIVAELPFKLVENPAFIEYTNALNGKFVLPSRHKVSKDVVKYYMEERDKLLAYLSKPTNTVHLTTDTWTSSCQRVNYMVVTAHFIDDDWVMHKRIINFRRIESHKGDDIGRELLDCIHGWGIKNAISMTVDNASTNDKAVDYLLKKLPNLYARGKHFQIRCMAHILNLIVKDGLSEYNVHVDCLRKAVRYIRNSTQRISRFKKCMKDLKLDSKQFLCGDCPTRWNSTYDMLKIVVDLKDVFFAYERGDNAYFRDLDRIPENVDFDVCKQLLEFLEKFKIKTEIVSATSKPLAHLFFREILDMDKHLRVWEVDPTFSVMGGLMREKYDKYWVDYIYITKENPMTEQQIKKKVADMVLEVENRLHELFIMYKERLENVEYHSASQEARNEDVVACKDGNDFFAEFLNVERSNSVAIETELKRYLKEPKVNFINRFDILRWWKQNAIRFPIVSRMAKDILAIQISTVASESAFSTGGRILDPYRTRLSSNIVEALVCTQDWVKKSRKPIVDDIDDILNDDDIAKEIEIAINKQNEKGNGTMHMED